MPAVIPDLLHLIWIDPHGGNAPPPPDVAERIDRWRTLHPQHDLKVWSENDLRTQLPEIPGIDLSEAIARTRFPAMQADLFRLAILWERGGFYTDLKNDPLMTFLGFLSPEARAIVTEHPPTIKGYERRLSNSFLASPPGHGFWLEWLDRACANVLSGLEADVTRVTGNNLLGHVLGPRRAAGIDDVLVIPSAQAWGTRAAESGWMRRRPASYNVDMSEHWSVLQTEQSLYLDL